MMQYQELAPRLEKGLLLKVNQAVHAMAMDQAEVHCTKSEGLSTVLARDPEPWPGGGPSAAKARA
jgi:hypothetical protein